MKKVFNFIVMLLVPLQMCLAGNVKKISVTFNKNDFTLTMNSSGLLDIISNKHVASYGEETSEPGLPLIPVNVLIPEGNSFASLTVSSNKSLIRENVTIATNPRMMRTINFAQEATKGLPKYANKVYPISSVVYKCTSCMDGYTILNFLVSPFEYDASSKKLYLNESITLSINLENSNEKITTLSMNGKNISDIIKSLVINGEEADARNISTQNASTNSASENNVQTLKSGLSSVLSLRPVSYKWKREAVVQSLSSEPSEKENITSTVANGPVEDDQTQYGFLAQEVEEVLPDAIKTDAEGHKMINYTAIIPMLVQAVQELQATVETQAQRIEQLSNGKGTQLIGDTNNKILSCSPNPTNGFVTITTQLDNDVKSAKIIISSLMGSREKELTVSPQSPTASTSISSLNSGIYIVSLFVNGKLADYQRLIKE